VHAHFIRRNKEINKAINVQLSQLIFVSVCFFRFCRFIISCFFECNIDTNDGTVHDADDDPITSGFQQTTEAQNENIKLHEESSTFVCWLF